jgi:hypothetical protein
MLEDRFALSINKRMESLEKVYHENTFGCTRRCTCHDAVHVNFGNVSLLLSKGQLADFSQYIYEAVVQCGEDNDDRDVRDIFIPTRDLCILFALSYNELIQLLDLTEQTLVMLQVDEALSAT